MDQLRRAARLFREVLPFRLDRQTPGCASLTLLLRLLLEERTHLVAQPDRDLDRRGERLTGAVLPAAGHSDELIGAAAQLVADEQQLAPN